MTKPRICVYAIAKNEEQFVDRWMDAMSEADHIVVLDTGSSDATVERLCRRGAEVTVEEIVPWRFDTARNRSLELVPQEMDLCVCTDLDEVFHPGWRAAIDGAWDSGVSQMSYRYTWSFTEDGREGVVFWPEKIHSRQGWRWVHPVHEVLQWVGPGMPGRKVAVQGVQLDHHPDPSKSRGQYLPLLELSVAEDPADDRNLHYLGREYLYYGQYDRCIETLQRHLSLPKARWADERAASMRYIARALMEKGERRAAWGWYLRAAAEAPHLREPYIDLAMLLYQEEAWEGVLYFTGCALALRERPDSYICEAAAWGSLPHDLQAMAFWHTGRPREALRAAEAALELEPGNERLRANVEVIREKI